MLFISANLTREGVMTKTSVFQKASQMADQVECVKNKNKDADLLDTDFNMALSQVISGMAIPTFVIDRHHIVRFWNKACENLTGIPSTDVIGTKNAWIAFYPKKRPVLADLVVQHSDRDSVAGFYDHFKRSTLVEYAFEAQAFFPKMGGKGKWLYFIATPLKNDSGETIGAIETFQDITKRKQTEEHHLQILEAIPDPVIVYDPEHRIVVINDAFQDTYGWTRDELIGSKIDFVPDKEIEKTRQAWQRTINGEKIVFETRRNTKAGKILDIQIKTAILKDPDGNHTASIIIHRDVTALKQAEKERDRLILKLDKLASTDSLTGADNRRQFFKKAKQEFARSKRYEHPFTVLMIDIDHFKAINDNFGHQIGDDTLKQMAEKCIALLRENDLFGRIGGEEFAAVLVATDPAKAAKIAERLRQELEKINIRTPQGLICFTVSIGVACLTKSDKNLEAIIKRADDALYQAKKNGRNQVKCA